jgi:hypothetical protein
VSEPTKKSVSDLIADTYEAIDTLNASRRETCAEHNERIRKLRDLAVSLHSARTQAAGSEMFEVGTIISPELERLLFNPTHNL